MKENDQKDQCLLRSIRPRNLLSFGPETPALKLEALNILIGPNGSGKSNLIEALALIRATPVVPQNSSADILGVLRRGGGAQAWIWQGAKNQQATIELVINNPKGKQPQHAACPLESRQALPLALEHRQDRRVKWVRGKEPLLCSVGVLVAVS